MTWASPCFLFSLSALRLSQRKSSHQTSEEEALRLFSKGYKEDHTSKFDNNTEHTDSQINDSVKLLGTEMPLTNAEKHDVTVTSAVSCTLCHPTLKFGTREVRDCMGSFQ